MYRCERNNIHYPFAVAVLKSDVIVGYIATKSSLLRIPWTSKFYNLMQGYWTSKVYVLVVIFTSSSEFAKFAELKDLQ